MHWIIIRALTSSLNSCWFFNVHSNQLTVVSEYVWHSLLKWLMLIFVFWCFSRRFPSIWCFYAILWAPLLNFCLPFNFYVNQQMFFSLNEVIVYCIYFRLLLLSIRIEDSMDDWCGRCMKKKVRAEWKSAWDVHATIWCY